MLPKGEPEFIQDKKKRPSKKLAKKSANNDSTNDVPKWNQNGDTLDPKIYLKSDLV